MAREEITKEEFIHGVKEMAADFNNPNGDLHALLEEFTDLAEVAKKYDPELSRLFLTARDGFLAVGKYAQTKFA